MIAFMMLRAGFDDVHVEKGFEFTTLRIVSKLRLESL